MLYQNDINLIRSMGKKLTECRSHAAKPNCVPDPVNTHWMTVPGQGKGGEVVALASPKNFMDCKWLPFLVVAH